jgi:hypothetical protein
MVLVFGEPTAVLQVHESEVVVTAGVVGAILILIKK